MSIQALREQKLQLSKEARHLLAEKGDTVWTKDDQAKFDDLSNKIESVTAQISAHEKMLEDEADIKAAEDFRIKGKQAPKDEAIKALDVFLRKQSRQYSDEDALLIRNTMSTTTGSEGGNTVQPIVAAQLVDAIKQYGFMRQEATQITTSSGVDMSFPTSDGTAEVGEWVAQNAAATAADPTFGTRALNVFKAGSKVVAVPIELLQDSQIDIAAFVLNRLGQRIGRISNQGYTTGTGSGQPFGLTAVASTGKTGTTGQTTSIIYDDLVDMVDSIDAGYLAGPNAPCWMFGQTLRRTIRKIKDTSGRPIWMPSYEAGLTGATPDMLLGYEVCLNNDMPTPAANAKSLAFGDLSKYYIRDALDVTLFKFEDSAYIKNGQIGFLAWARTGGNLLDLSAVKVYQHSAT